MSVIGAAIVETVIFTALFYSASTQPRFTFSAGSSSRSMGEQVREPMEIPSSDRLRRRSPAFWLIVGVLILLNVWYDYYHPLGIIFDVILAVVLLIWYLNKSRPG